MKKQQNFKRRIKKVLLGEDVSSLTVAVLGINKGERIDKKVKSEVIERANDQSYNKSGKMVVPGLEISATSVMRNVRKNERDMEFEERKEEDKIKAKNIYIQVDEDHIKEIKKAVQYQE